MGDIHDEEELPWKIIDKYFKDNPYALVQHHLDSYNAFFGGGISKIFRENNPIKIGARDPNDSKTGIDINLYIGGKNGDEITYGKPVIFDDKRNHFMFPNIARLRNMTYGFDIHYDVEVEIKNIKSPDIVSFKLERIYLGKFPIMLSSNYCILKGLDRMTRFQMGECKNDVGGYFIIDGKEKCIIAQEKFADNMIYLRDKVDDKYSHSVTIRSVSEDASKPQRSLSIAIVTPSTTYTNNQIVVIIPNVRKPVPLFILMRALGVESDKDIITYCLLDLEEYKKYIDLFIPSIHDAGRIFTQDAALRYIASFMKNKTIAHALEILSNYLLPHIGVMNFQNKAYFLGYMIKQLLRVFTKEIKPTDRDSFMYKRVEMSGNLLYDLFKEYYKEQQRGIKLNVDKNYNSIKLAKAQGEANQPEKADKLSKSMQEIKQDFIMASQDFFSERHVEAGFRKAFKGSWGSTTHSKREGVVQDVNRLSFNSFISLLRKINLPFDPSAKIIGPRMLHTSQWGIIDPVDTPDGGNVGLHKHLTIMAYITAGCPSVDMIEWIKANTNMRLLSECSTEELSVSCKIVINGNWFAVTNSQSDIVEKFKMFRRNGLIPIYTSIFWDIKENAIFIYTDSGRLCHPVYYINNNKEPSFKNDGIAAILNDSSKYTWSNLISGFTEKPNGYDVKTCKIYNTDDFYKKPPTVPTLLKNQAIIEYLDTAETQNALIKISGEHTITQNYTHMEIHPSLMLGVLGNQIVFPENNQLPRDLFACGQAKQSVSMYHTNFENRFDKSGLVLNCGQIPLIKSRYLKYINHEEMPCGENVIVAIMSWNGYNVEDSILFNEGSLQRGMFRNTYYSTYESRESSSSVKDSTTDSVFTNIENENKKGTSDGRLRVDGFKRDKDYSDLDSSGIIKENTPVTEKSVLIGKIIKDEKDNHCIDDSVYPKKGQLGYVDKTVITEGDEGFRIAKVRIREQRVPSIGDKFSSRCGQKGTVGLVVSEVDMPYTKDGIRPDIIINPHALPSRMTIGQLVEMVMGKACDLSGAFGDCTAFVNKGPKNEKFGEILNERGFNSSGEEILYNGTTGEQIEANIYIGPTYYMRLKHMVKDKINYRAEGPMTVLTRQPVQGRANDGGLRIGEMERDVLIAHGISGFLNESLMVRGDQYYMAICNKTGTIAIYNQSLDLFISPLADGPIKFEKNPPDGLNIEKITRFGRSFSIVRVPYAFKLLIQELQTMNIQMRLITQDNVNQLLNLSFSDGLGLKKVAKSLNIDLNIRSDEDIGKIVGATVSKLGVELTPFNKGDTNKLLSIINEDSYLYLRNGKKWTESSTATFIKYCEEEEDMVPEKRENFYWAIRLNQELVGMVGIHTVKYDKDGFYITFFIAEAVRRRGYALTSITKAIEMFRKLRPDIRSLYADIHEGNAGSAETLIKSGFNPMLGVNGRQIEISVGSKRLLRFNRILGPEPTLNPDVATADVVVDEDLSKYILKYKNNYALAKKEVNEILNKIDYPYLRYYVSAQRIRENFERLKGVSYIVSHDPYTLNNITVKPNEMLFEGKYVLITDPRGEFQIVDEISDYFNEECRNQCRFFGSIGSTRDFYQKDLGKIIDILQRERLEINVKNMRDVIFTHGKKEKYGECSTFKPKIMRYIINLFKARAVLDMSSGWGDRLISAMASDVDTYHGYDPNACLHPNYVKMIEFFKGEYKNPNATFEMYLSNFESSPIYVNFYDLMFTSPPYFDIEIYDNNASTQSTYTTKNDESKWYNQFLLKWVEKIYVALKEGGIMAFNINQFDRHNFVTWLINDLRMDVRFDFLGTISYGGRKDNQPIFLWRKRPVVNSKLVYYYTFIISSKKEMKGLDYSTLRESLLNDGLQETTDPTTKPFLLWMEQLENNKFDDRYYKTQCFIMNILSDEKTIITDKSNLYINFNKKYPEACEKYMAQTWVLDDFLKDEVLSKNKNKAYIVRPVGKGAFSGKDIIIVDNAAKLEEAKKLRSKKYDSIIVSTYVTNPMLYKKRKFHLRTYFLISMINGKYKTYFYNVYELFTAKNPYTNIDYTDKNVHDTHFASTEGDILCPRDLEPSLKEIFSTKIYPNMEDCMTYISKLMEGHAKPYAQAENAFEVFGCDFLVKDDYDVVLMEINDKTGFTMNKKETKETFSEMYLGVINTMIKSSLQSVYNTRSKKIEQEVGAGKDVK